MRARSVWGLMPSSTAAPCSPSMRPRVRASADSMCAAIAASRSATAAPSAGGTGSLTRGGGRGPSARATSSRWPSLRIYHEPANAFVYEFLGDVNVFHARVEGEQARVYVRPHLLEVELRERGDVEGELRARVERIHAAGPSVKLELVTDAGDRVQAELTQERHRALGLSKDTIVFVRPRQKRVFVNDFSI